MAMWCSHAFPLITFCLSPPPLRYCAVCLGFVGLVVSEVADHHRRSSNKHDAIVIAFVVDWFAPRWRWHKRSNPPLQLFRIFLVALQEKKLLFLLARPFFSLFSRLFNPVTIKISVWYTTTNSGFNRLSLSDRLVSRINSRMGFCVSVEIRILFFFFFFSRQ